MGPRGSIAGSPLTSGFSEGMSPVGWEALGQWGEDVARIEPLAGGVANDVWSMRVHGHLAVGRLGARSRAAHSARSQKKRGDANALLVHDHAGEDRFLAKATASIAVT
jgi:hypothetical protein